MSRAGGLVLMGHVGRLGPARAAGHLEPGMQDHLDERLVEQGHADQVAGVLRVWTQECGLDGWLAADGDQRLPRYLAWQCWLDLRRDRSRNTMDARRRLRAGGSGSPGYRGYCAGQAAADLGRVELVLDLLQTTDDRPEPVEPGPFGPPGGCPVGARSCQGSTNGPGDPQQEDDHHNTRASPPVATSARSSHVPPEGSDLNVAPGLQLHVCPLSTSVTAPSMNGCLLPRYARSLRERWTSGGAT